MSWPRWATPARPPRPRVRRPDGRDPAPACGTSSGPTIRLTMAVSGTGSAGMEAVVVNLIEPGDKMLVCVNGVFGTPDGRRGRAGRGQSSPRSSAPGAKSSTREEVQRRRSSEGSSRSSSGSSTPRPPPAPGSPSRRLPGSAHEAGAMIAIDTVTSLGRRAGGDRRLGDRRGLLGHAEVPELPARPRPRLVQCPRAAEVIANRKTKVQSWYLDMQMIQRYWGSDRFYHHTAPISMNYALREALALVVEEGTRAPARPPPAEPPGPEGGPRPRWECSAT